MSWTDIANKGSSSWWIVQSNQPAGSGSYANAVPDVDDWNTLSDGKQGGYRFPLKRAPGIDIEFALRWEYANQYRGKGMFLRTIWTDVSTCTVPDGFNVAISFACSNPWNDNQSNSPPWPAAMIAIDMATRITTPKWEKQHDKWKVLLKYNGGLEMR